jgi:hypothetical protein
MSATLICILEIVQFVGTAIDPLGSVGHAGASATRRHHLYDAVFLIIGLCVDELSTGASTTPSTSCSPEWFISCIWIYIYCWVCRGSARRLSTVSMIENTQHSYVYTRAVPLRIVSRGCTTGTILAASDSFPMPDTLQARHKIIHRAVCLWEHDQGQQLGPNENHDSASTVHIQI